MKLQVLSKMRCKLAESALGRHLEAIDQKIINLLQADGRKTDQELSDRVGLSAIAAISGFRYGMIWPAIEDPRADFITWREFKEC